MDSTHDIIKNLKKGQRRALAKAITLVESDLREHRKEVENIFTSLDTSMSNKETIRIGISGSPGAGKSTFIEEIGLKLIEKGHKVAVLAVDPSSPKSGGSILGDKTRMEKLSQSDQAFIRPSPSKQSMGGVARTTRETIYLCEAAGFNIILVETVGVGQSEYDVAAMVDFFYLLMLPNAGDELQGIKKGIIELADSIIVHKADKNNLENAMIAKTQYENALHTIQKDHFWQPNVLTCSSLERTGLEEVIENIFSYVKKSKDNNLFYPNRDNQQKVWFKTLIEKRLISTLFENKAMAKHYRQLEDDCLTGKISPLQASQQMVDILNQKLIKK